MHMPSAFPILFGIIHVPFDSFISQNEGNAEPRPPTAARKILQPKSEKTARFGPLFLGCIAEPPQPKNARHPVLHRLAPPRPTCKKCLLHRHNMSITQTPVAKASRRGYAVGCNPRSQPPARQPPAGTAHKAPGCAYERCNLCAS